MERGNDIEIKQKKYPLGWQSETDMGRLYEQINLP